jgi:hypothetical protein
MMVWRSLCLLGAIGCFEFMWSQNKKKKKKAKAARRARSPPCRTHLRPSPATHRASSPNLHCTRFAAWAITLNGQTQHFVRWPRDGGWHRRAEGKGHDDDDLWQV